MAQRLVEILSPVMDELLPIIGKQFDNISYTYDLRTTETPKQTFTSRTELIGFTVHFRSTMKIRTREMLKRKIVTHFEHKTDRKKEARMRGCQIESIDLSTYQLTICFKELGVGYRIMPKLLENVTPYPFQTTQTD